MLADTAPGVKSDWSGVVRIDFATASSFLPDILVMFGVHHVVVDRVVERTASVTSMATACFPTVEQLLLTQVVKMVMTDLPCSFHSSSSTKGPTRAATALEFHGRYCTLCPPIKFFVRMHMRDMLKLFRIGIFSGTVMAAAHQFHELLFGPVGEQVVPNNIGDVLAEVYIMVVDGLVIFVPYVLSELVFLYRGV